jgi:MoxR-like ATPase
VCMSSSRRSGYRLKSTSSSSKLLEEVHKDGIDRVFAAMNEKVVSHSKLKEALVLGMISQEHVYVEGPPGAAKTLISETVSKSTDLEFFFYQLHRDTRLDELIGDASIVREKTPSGGEIIKQTTVPGGILTAEICVLDDITRCPGEALNVLLRVLNERKFGSDHLPLRTAIATGNPNQENYYVEQLDPASLDRFTFQVETKGFVSTGEWTEAMKVLNMYSSSSFSTSEQESSRPIRDLLSDAHQVLMPQVEVPTRVKIFLLSFLKHLKEKFALNGTFFLFFFSTSSCSHTTHHTHTHRNKLSPDRSYLSG